MDRSGVVSETPLNRVLGRLDAVRKTPSGFTARCPSHDDRHASLSISEGDDGRVLVHCHAGCDLDAVLQAIELVLSDLFPRMSTAGDKKTVVATYDYTDEHGTRLFQAIRYDNKTFAQRRPNGHDGWIWNLKGVPRVPYRLPQLIDAVNAGRLIVIVEGEKDVDTLEHHGVAATTNPMGAGKWRKDFARYFKGATVAIIRDNDDVGREHALDVAEKLRGAATTIGIVDLDGLPEHGDVTDWLQGHTVDELYERITAALSIPPNHDAHLHTPPPPPTEAPPIAYAARILDRFREEVGVRGLVGEDRTAATVYLVVTSRLLDQQVSTTIKGHSSSGKSYTVATTLKFFPDDAVIEFTAFSERALVFSKQEYRHRTIVIYELVALREGNDDNLTSYFVRSLLSEGRIVYEQTVKDTQGGGFTTKVITKEGPTNLILTTTKTSVHTENETRVLSLNTDDSREQTKRVLLELANETDDEHNLDEWHALQRWLAGANHRVTIPYARELAEAIPPIAVRLRRDFGAVLSLIRAHAMLHQATRDTDDRGRIVATLDDYEVVRDLVAEVLSAGVEATVPDTVRHTVEAVKALFIDTGDDKRDGVSVNHIAKRLKLDRSTTSRRLRRAADGGYIKNLEDRRKPGRWATGDPMPEDVALLPTPCPRCGRISAGQDGVCNCADGLGGVDSHPESRAGAGDDEGRPLDPDEAFAFFEAEFSAVPDDDGDPDAPIDWENLPPRQYTFDEARQASRTRPAPDKDVHAASLDRECEHCGEPGWRFFGHTLCAIHRDDFIFEEEP
jgi:hypothetical protein